MMNWDDLRYIRVLAEAGTLSAAAERLGVHPSTVFRRLGQIEQRLGVRLFDRHHHGLSLTAPGEEVSAMAERLGSEVDGLERRLAGRDTRPSGSVCLTTTDTLLQGGLAPVLTRFREHYPDIRLEVVTGNPFLSLSKRDADVALRPTASPPDNLVGRRITDIATAIYAAPRYLAGAPPTEALECQDWIAPDDSLAHLASARWLQQRLPDVHPVMRCNNVTSLLALARAGAGLAPLPCFLGDADPHLVRVHGPLPELSVGLWLLTHWDLRHVARIRALLDHLHAELSVRQSRFSGTQDGTQGT